MCRTLRSSALVLAGALLASSACLPDDVEPERDGGVEGLDGAVARDAGPRDGGEAIVERERWWRGQVFYEIFVRSFQDSDGDGVGDFAGLTSRLDYLASLGVKGVWLMPIHPSPSYHGYDVTDYLGVNPDYGTLADFETFLAEAHARDIRVVLDFVVNHSSRNHPWFVNARSRPGAEMRDFYNWRDDDPGWRAPVGLGPAIWHPFDGVYYYGVFGSGLPDLNHANEEVYRRMLEVADTWLSRGVDGFRFDAVRYLFENEQGVVADLPETHAYFKRMKADVLRDHPNALFVAEAWSSTTDVAAYYGDGDEFDLAFNFDLSQGLQQAAAGAGTTRLTGALSDAARLFEDRAFEAPFITNHDMNRLMRDARVDARAFAVAAATLFALPGTPFVYYGEEIGMRGGGLEVDEDKRTTFRWTADAPGYGFTTGTPWRARAEDDGVDVASQTGDPDSLLELYRALIALRAAEVMPRIDDFTTLNGMPSGVVGLAWGAAGDRLVFAANYGAAPQTIEVPSANGAVALLTATASVTATRVGGDVAIVLPERAFGYVRMP